MNYADYEADEFLLDSQFVDWVKTGQNDAFWQEFLHRHPAQRPTVEQARAIIQATATLPLIAPTDKQIRQMWQTVERSIQEQPTEAIIKPLWSARTWLYWAAASVILLSIGTIWYASQPTSVTYGQLVTQSPVALQEVVNTGTTPKLVRLPDGSTVRLEANSRLSYPTSFNTLARREVYLSGKAFFEVARNARQPFLVYANELITKVLGTSFTIDAPEGNQRITVDVRTGQVAVFTQYDPQINEKQTSQLVSGLVVTANQHITFSRETKQLAKSLVDQPALLPTVLPTTSFDFDEAPAPVIFNALEKAYGVEIVYDAELLSNCRLTASLTNESLFDKVRLVCQGLDATYEVIDTRIIISAKGCSTP
ncbi:MAG: FecR family protein [Cytophagaceae bacterium]|nr:MAG: FecR family protein [Cytophagaceae bacterium]